MTNVLLFVCPLRGIEIYSVVFTVLILFICTTALTYFKLQHTRTQLTFAKSFFILFEFTLYVPSFEKQSCVNKQIKLKNG